MACRSFPSAIVVICHFAGIDYVNFTCNKFNVCMTRSVMCYGILPRKQALTDENKQRKECVSMSRQVKAWIVEARNAMTADKRKHPEVEAQTPSTERERLAG